MRDLARVSFPCQGKVSRPQAETDGVRGARRRSPKPHPAPLRGATLPWQGRENRAAKRTGAGSSSP